MIWPLDSKALTDGATLGLQELGSMYDYLAKIILLGPSGAGKSVPLELYYITQTPIDCFAAT